MRNYCIFSIYHMVHTYLFIYIIMSIIYMYICRNVLTKSSARLQQKSYKIVQSEFAENFVSFFPLQLPWFSSLKKKTYKTDKDKGSGEEMVAQ